MLLSKNKIIETINKDFNGRAVEGGGCVYKTEPDESGNCKKCAIGLFIPENHTGELVEGSVTTLLGNFPDLWDSMPMPNLAFLQRFQDCHDSDLNRDQSLKEQKEILVKFVEKNYDIYLERGEQKC